MWSLKSITNSRKFSKIPFLAAKRTKRKERTKEKWVEKFSWWPIDESGWEWEERNAYTFRSSGMRVFCHVDFNGSVGWVRVVVSLTMREMNLPAIYFNLTPILIFRRIPRTATTKRLVLLSRLRSLRMHRSLQPSPRSVHSSSSMKPSTILCTSSRTNWSWPRINLGAEARTMEMIAKPVTF